ncbi:MAG: hypothetical protein DRJ47_09840 [Thermoprotei archaeon]|nr:MAG: hypothetical protein DRJ47_09840 [Thermoprotei archaeon]
MNRKIVSGITLLVVLAVSLMFIYPMLIEREGKHGGTLIVFEGFVPPVKGTPVSGGDQQVLTLLLSSTTQQVADTSTTGYISVSGSSQVKLTADLVKISITAIVENTNASKAVSRLAEKMNNIVSKLEALGITKDDIYTVYYSVTPLYDYKSSPPKLTGYRAEHTISLTVKDKVLAAKIVDVASEAGADKVNIAFTISKEDFEAIYMSALAEAAKNAYKKAEVISSSLNYTLGNIIEISEVSYLQYTPLRGIYFAAAQEKTGTEFYQTEATVSAQVTLKIAITPKD